MRMTELFLTVSRTVVRDEAGNVLEVETKIIGGPKRWEHRHEMLIDACAQVKREAGVES